jgi:hypothetical protein
VPVTPLGGAARAVAVHTDRHVALNPRSPNAQR